jgi:hypothetical protein
VDPCRDVIDLRDGRIVRLCDLAADDPQDLAFLAALARNRLPPPCVDLDRDFFTGCRLSAPFETAVARLTAFRSGRASAAAFPTTAPITPPILPPLISSKAQLPCPWLTSCEAYRLPPS